MKQNILLTVLLFITIKSIAQDSKFSVELNYPIPFDFIGVNYNGIIDFGADYRFSNLGPINIGVSFNGGILVDDFNQSSVIQDFKTTSYIIQPRIFGELDLESIEKIHPTDGLGYTIMVFKASGSLNGIEISNSDFTHSGFNFNFGIAYDITEKLFIQAQYDFIRLGVDNNVNTNVSILKIGLGYRL